MRIAICDDEPLWREQLAERLEKYYKSLDVLIQCFESGEKLLVQFPKNTFDLVFLDIEMPGVDGLSVAGKLRQEHRECIIIFLTSHTDLAMEGYEVDAFRFLAKPVEETKLYRALQAVEKKMSEDAKIAVTENGTQSYLRCRDIRYIHCENIYLQIVTEDRSYLVRKKLKDILEELPKEWFVQVHRSYIVNMLYVTSFDGHEIALDDGTTVAVSKGKREMFRQRMMQYMKEKC